MLKLVKLLAVWPLRVADNGLPLPLKRSTLTVRLTVPVFIITISVAQPPPTTNCGNKTAPGPPPLPIGGSGPTLPERFVTGIVLKFAPRNLRPITDTGRVEEPAEVIATVPVTSRGTDG